MIKKTMTYVDYNGVSRTEDFYFNLNPAEVIELEVSAQGGLTQMIEGIIAAQDKKEIIAIFKRFLLLAYGVKSPDGVRFIKNQELRDAFEQCPAYSKLFMQLAQDENYALDFFKAIVPQPDEVEKIKKN